MGVSDPVRISFPMLAIVTGLWLAFSSLNACGLMADQKGFVSLDCGADGSYIDTATTSLNWTSDNSGFGLSDVSNTTSVDSPLHNPPRQFSRIRYFPGEQRKYCYVFNGPDHGVQQTQPYLVRASFWLGPGPAPFTTLSSQQINFKLLINADHWDNISINLPQTEQEGAVVKEMYVVADLATVSVCLAGRGIGMDIPFISSLELRPLNGDMRAVELMEKTQPSKALFLEFRVDYGSTSGNDVRFPDDVFDRVWTADTTTPLSSTQSPINTIKVNEHPPMSVMQTAYVSDFFMEILATNFIGTHGYFYVLYFSEISKSVTAPGQRVFEYQVTNASGIMLASYLIDLYALNDLYSVYERFNMDKIVIVREGEYLHFTFNKTATSTYGPLICALELHRLSDHEMSLGTLESDVHALDTIKDISFQGFDSWRGDPCLPYAYNWLDCSLDIRPRIVTLSLSNRNLVGEIPASIKNLTALVELDLQGNKLNGQIPEFLAELPNLKILLLQDNNFSGVIPQALLDKVTSFGLNLSFAGNQYLCTASNSQPYCLEQANTISTKKSHNLLVLAGTFAAIVLGVVVLIGLSVFVFRRRKNYIPPTTVELVNRDALTSSIVPHARVVEHSRLAQPFSYQEIQAITKDFATKLGQGSFGPVYYGVLIADGVNVAVSGSSLKNVAPTKVAVKLLSKDSRQGIPEFLNEVDLLSRAHHRNIVGLIGYCIELKLLLVYEYMSNGSLHQALHSGSGRRLAWRDRLKIVVGSAEGLEYLHKGCKPRIIHRDVKSSNILLDDEMEGRISDFGISRSKYASKTDSTQTVTQVQGTWGYIDPEYFETIRINDRTDVYAFGIVLLEIVCGRLPIRENPPGSGLSQNIVDWVRPLVERGDIDAIVDAAIANDYNVSSMWTVIDVAMRCVEPHSNERPNMSEVSSELKSALSMELKNDLAATSNNPYDMDVPAR